MSESRALTNLFGNGVVTIGGAKWVKELDRKKLDDVLNNRAPDGKTHDLSSYSHHLCPHSLPRVWVFAHN
ncbi:hypothetical protein AB2894_26335, partial [Escherichia coli]